MSVLMGANPCGTVLCREMRLQSVWIPAKTPTIPNAEKPRTAGLCGRPVAETPPGLYLVLLSNRQVPSTVPHRRGESGGKQRRCLSGVQGCHSRSQSRTQRLTGGIAGETGRSRPLGGGSSCVVWSADLFHPCLLFRRRLFDPVQQVLRLLQPLCHLEQPRPGVGAVYTK